MPKSLSHVVVLTDDLAEVVRFCTEVAGLTAVAPYEIPAADLATLFGWPELDAPVAAAFVGEGPGSLDLVEIPAPLRGEVRPGLRLLAVANRDVLAAGAAATGAGFATRGPFEVATVAGDPMSLVEVAAGGLSFELVQFG
jgi:catechol 2,3-dioxygenase-like lactoylglutathione lyase family enzyme